MPLITPDATAGAIYVVRHPHDVCVSYAHHYRVGLDQAVEALARDDNVLPRSDKLLPQFIGSWAQNVHGWTTAPGMTRHVMRYEDMQARPGETFGAVVRFLGLPADPRRLWRAIRFSSFREMERQERAEGFIEARPDGTTRFFRRGRVGQGEPTLSAAQKQTLDAALGPVMQRFGYHGSARW